MYNIVQDNTSQDMVLDCIIHVYMWYSKNLKTYSFIKSQLTVYRFIDCFSSMFECAKINWKIYDHTCIQSSSNNNVIISYHTYKTCTRISVYRLKFVVWSSYKITKSFAIFAIDGYRMIIYHHCPARYTYISCHLTKSNF